MPQILDYFIEPAYGQVCFSGQDAELSWQASFNDMHVAVDDAAITVAVSDGERDDQVEVEVYQGRGDKPPIQYLQRIYNGIITLSQDGLLIFAPTGDEVLLEEVANGYHKVEIYRDGYPTSRLVVIIDADG